MPQPGGEGVLQGPELERALARLVRAPSRRVTGACPCAPLPAKAVEEFVIAELRKVTLDRKLATRITSGLSNRAVAERATLHLERDQLPGEIAKLSVEATRLVDSLGAASVVAQPLLQRRLDEVSVHLGEGKRRLVQVEERLVRIDEARLDLEWVQRVLRDFEPLWKQLNEENRARVVRALIEEIRVDELRGSLRIAFRTSDVATRAA